MDEARLTGWRHGGHMWAQHLDSMASPGVVASTTCGADDSPDWVIGLQELNQRLNQRDDDRKMHDDKWTKWRNQWGISEESVRNQVILVIWIPSNLSSGSWGWRPRSYRSCDLSIREWQSREHVLSIPVSLVVPTVIRLQFCSSWTFIALWNLSQIASMVSLAKLANCEYILI